MEVRLRIYGYVAYIQRLRPNLSVYTPKNAVYKLRPTFSSQIRLYLGFPGVMCSQLTCKLRQTLWKFKGREDIVGDAQRDPDA